MSRRFATLADVADELRTIDQGHLSLAYPWQELARAIAQLRGPLFKLGVSHQSVRRGWYLLPQFDPFHERFDADEFQRTFDRFNPDTEDES